MVNKITIHPKAVEKPKYDLSGYCPGTIGIREGVAVIKVTGGGIRLDNGECYTGSVLCDRILQTGDVITLVVT